MLVSNGVADDIAHTKALKDIVDITPLMHSHLILTNIKLHVETVFDFSQILDFEMIGHFFAKLGKEFRSRDETNISST